MQDAIPISCITKAIVMSDRGKKRDCANAGESPTSRCPIAKEPGLFDKAEVRKTVREGPGQVGMSLS